MPSLVGVAASAKSVFSDDALEKSRKTLGIVLGRKLTLEEASVMVEDLINLELYLRELRRKYGRKGQTLHAQEKPERKESSD